MGKVVRRNKMFEVIKNYFKRGNDLPPKERAREKVLIALEIVLVVCLILEFTGLVDFAIINAIFMPALIIYAFINLFKNVDRARIISLILIFIISVALYFFIVTVV